MDEKSPERRFYAKDSDKKRKSYCKTKNFVIFAGDIYPYFKERYLNQTY